MCPYGLSNVNTMSNYDEQPRLARPMQVADAPSQAWPKSTASQSAFKAAFDVKVWYGNQVRKCGDRFKFDIF